jgi:hypothetical protein
MDGLVYVNWGRMVVDCPAVGCKYSYLYEGQPSRICDAPGDGCNASFQQIAQENLLELLAELSRRPNEKNRNWYPVGHRIAEESGYPMGQSVADLAAEYEMQVTGNGMD